MDNNYAGQANDAFRRAGDDYVSNAVSAHQELMQLGMNLFHRELAAGQRIASSRDFEQALNAWTDLMKQTVEDFSGTTTRLLDGASSVGSKIAQSAQGGTPRGCGAREADQRECHRQSMTLCKI